MMNAQWIAPSGIDANAENCYFKVRKEFEVPAIAPAVLLKTACEGWYRLELNGHCVSRGPVRASRNVNYVDAVEVAQWLRHGLNTIEILVRYTTRADFLFNLKHPGVWCCLEGLIGTDATWETTLCNKEWPADAPWFSQQAGYCEWHDTRFANEVTPVDTVVLPPDSPVCRKELIVHDTPCAQETVHLPANIAGAYKVPAADWKSIDLSRLNTSEEHLPMDEAPKQQCYQLTSGGTHDIVIPPSADHGGVAIIFDFDREISGRVEIDLEAPEGTVADVSYEEELWKGDRLRSDHTHTNPTYRFCDRMILSQGRHTVGNFLVDRGFRMIQLVLRDFTAPVVLHAVRGIDRRYPLGDRSSFFCGDYRLNRLWDIAKETISACVTDVYTDCPWRERLFYINDMAVANRTMLSVFGDWRLTRHGLDIAFDEMEEDDMITSSVPGRRDSPFSVILSAVLTLPMVLRDYWLYSGDSATVRKHYPKLLRIMNRFHSWLQSDGTIVPPDTYWNFFDWSYELNGTVFTGKPSSLLNYLYLIACRMMRQLSPAAEMPFPVSDDEISTLAQQTLKAFWASEYNCLLDGRDCDASFEVLKALGIPDPRHRQCPISRLPHALAIIAGTGNGPDDAFKHAIMDESKLTPDFYYLFFILEAMSQCGEYGALMHTINKYWSQVLDSGSPTVWENGVHDPGKGGFGGSASLCHGFSTAPAGFLQRLVLGITPTTPGFKTFDFIPRIPAIGFAKGRVATPHGAIFAEWHYTDGAFHATIIVPPECQANTPAGLLPTGTHHIDF